MEGKQIGLMIFIAIFVSIIVSIIVSITAINLTQNSYTKEETDTKFSNLGPTLLNQFNNQVIKNSDGDYGGVSRSCSDICGSEYTCVNGMVRLIREINHGSYNDRFSQEALVGCNEKLKLGIQEDSAEWKEYSLSCACR